MIVERNEFRLKYGKAKEAIATWKQISEELVKDGRFQVHLRLLTDITGPAYTLIVESLIRSYTEVNPINYMWQTNQRVRELYQQFVPLCESSHREVYKIEAES